MSETDSLSPLARVGRMCRKNPLAAVCFIGGTLGGAVVANLLPLTDMTTLAKTLGGALCGAWLAMFPIGFRLYGDDE